MGRKKHRKKKYYSVMDRPIFKILSSVLMTLVFAFLYYLVVILMERPGALTYSVPCVLVVVWVAVKQRHFWWIWLICAGPCVALIVLFNQSSWAFLVETAYWVMSFAMCEWEILAHSRARSRAIKRKKIRQQQQYSHEPVQPRPRDELLEKLFADGE